MQKPSIPILLVYNPKDQEYVDDLTTHLFSLIRKGYIELFDVHQDIDAGANKKHIFEEELQRAKIILVFISNNLYRRNTQNMALKVESLIDQKTVVPIKIAKFDFQDSTFYKLKGLPNDEQPIAEHPNRDSVLYEITKEITKLVERLRSSITEKNNASPPVKEEKNIQSPTKKEHINIPTSTMTHTEFIQLLLSKGKLKEAIAELMRGTKLSNQNDISQSLILLSARYNSNETSNNAGILSAENYGLAKRRISNSLLSYTNDYRESPHIVFDAPQETKPKITTVPSQKANTMLELYKERLKAVQQELMQLYKQRDRAGIESKGGYNNRIDDLESSINDYERKIAKEEAKNK